MAVSGELGIVVCSSAYSFGSKVLGELKRICEGTGISPRRIVTTVAVFENSEIKTVIGESIRKCRHLFVLCDVENHYPRPLGSDRKIVADYADSRMERFGGNMFAPSTADNERELKTAVSAAKTADVDGVSLILPSYPYARQDKPKEREGVTAADFARELEGYGIVRRVVTLDVHNNAVSGFFSRATILDMHASKYIIRYLNSALPGNVLGSLVVSPTDVGGGAMAMHYAGVMHKRYVPVGKNRDYTLPGTVESIDVDGDVSGKYVLVVDDMVDTAGTAEKVVEALTSSGALGVYMACSLGLFNGKAVERIGRLYNCGKGPLKGVISTNAVYHPKSFYDHNPWCFTVPMERPFAELILGLHKNESVSHLLE